VGHECRAVCRHALRGETTLTLHYSMGFHWHLYETAPGVWNETYIDAVVDLANQFMGNGIYVIFDMHQVSFFSC
jgi:hypothetical protein